MLLRCPFLLVARPHTNPMSPAKQPTSQASNWHSQTLHGHDRIVKSGLPIHSYQYRTSISPNQLVTRTRNAKMYTRASTKYPYLSLYSFGLSPSTLMYSVLSQASPSRYDKWMPLRQECNRCSISRQLCPIMGPIHWKDNIPHMR